MNSRMFGDISRKILRVFTCGNTRLCSSAGVSLQEYFVNPRIYNLLRLVTFPDPVSVHRPAFRKLRQDTIKLLSDAELETVKAYGSIFTEQRLQMPPVLNARKDVGDQVIAKDPKLQGILPNNSRLVFADIDPRCPRSKRLIVVREPDGVLRHATASERDRVNQVYFPLPGRTLWTPKMFEEQYLQSLLDRGSFLYILDRACVQFEPDDPNFIRVCRRVYDHVDELSWTPIHHTTYQYSNKPNPVNPLQLLRHTRHYGPLALYLIAVRNHSGGLIFEALSCQHFARVGWLLRLTCLLRPDCPIAAHISTQNLELPPPEEINASDQLNKDLTVSLRQSELDQLLIYIKYFIDHEPLSNHQKTLLEVCYQRALESIQSGNNLSVAAQ